MKNNDKGPGEPATPYAVAFIDGQNLFHCAREAFGHGYPNYDPKKLAEHVCRIKGWHLSQVRFYTGVPTKERSPRWHEFWAKKGTRMSRSGVFVVTRPLRYTAEMLDDGSFAYIPREKGIDVRIAIDVMNLAELKAYDVALIFSQDQDLSELASAIRDLARRHNRWLKVASAFPVGPGTQNRRGINGTDWITIDQTEYDANLDPHQ